MTVREALEAVVNESNNPYAKTYAKAALEVGGSQDAVLVESNVGSTFVLGICPKRTGNMMEGEELYVQCLYILSNLSHWRGPRAKEVKEILKKVPKV